ncbi:hypothetical protein LEP1GSC036_2341 [Leptospira weilii str. 2006001853]|uniref:Uncharacterized protein n=1 Tax=Leptospira weilii str. 2006001853 TaxID=1001589 RepID=A0A828YZN2_9LEPT|nr:hypothetical protein LEP1GSC036_2341 [Leptospira weilii str. 2006001853]
MNWNPSSRKCSEKTDRFSFDFYEKWVACRFASHGKVI